ncbi:hypothetical protein [Demequina aurantiaca]|uniref:hypothetical protein n=1 Tax=Demequina aurantiaca TaxID=676200 RepID=UPI003D341436
MESTKFRTASLMVTGAVALGITLTGCGSNPVNDLADKAGNAVVENGGEAIVEDITGADVEFGSLPEGFPDAIPLVDGDIVVGTKIAGDEGDGDGFVLSIAVDTDPVTVAEQVKAAFGGWEESSAWNEALQGGGFSDEDWSVIVAVLPGDSDADSLVGYTVIPQTD